MIKTIIIEDSMVTRHNSFYRSCLSDEEKKEFREFAQKEGSVTEVHDNLLRSYNKSKRKEEKGGQVMCSRFSVSSNGDLPPSLLGVPSNVTAGGFSMPLSISLLIFLKLLDTV